MKPKRHNSEERPHSPLSSRRKALPFRLGAFPDESPRIGVPIQRVNPAGVRSRQLTSWAEPEPAQEGGVYIISVAARILEMHPQTLRKYERAGLVTPSRTVGLLRLYSAEDIARLKLIKHLVGDLGLNLAGVQLILEVFNNLLRIRSRLPWLETTEVKDFLAETLDEVFELLHAHVY